MIREKKIFIFLLLALIATISVAVVFYFRSGKIYPSWLPQKEQSSQAKLFSSYESGSAQKSTKYSVVMTLLNTESPSGQPYFYALQGTLLEDPTYAGNNLVLTVAVDGDSAKQPIILELTSKTGKMQFAEKKDNGFIWTLTDTEVIKSSLKKGNKIEARFVFTQTDLANKDNNVKILEEMISDKNIEANTLLVPAMVAKI